MRCRFSWSIPLGILLLLLGVIPMVASTWFLYGGLHQEALLREEAALRSWGQAQGARISDYLARAVVDAQTLAQWAGPYFRDGLPPLESYKALGYHPILFLDGQGQVLGGLGAETIGSRPVSRSPLGAGYYRVAQDGRSLITDLGSYGSLTAAFSLAPIMDGEEFLGAVALGLPLQKLEGLLEGGTRLLTTSEEEVAGLTVSIDGSPGWSLALEVTRQEESFWKRSAPFLVVLGILLLLLSWGLGRWLGGPMEQLLEVLQGAATGDPSLSMAVGRGPWAVVAEGVNGLVAQLASLQEERETLQRQMDQAAQEVAAGNEKLAQRSQEQGVALDYIGETVGEISLQAQRNTVSAQEAETLAEATLQVVEEGHQVVGSTMEAMEAITQWSHRIGAIIRTVNDIAFQINLLALNAAVEAARAGEHGRGFGVVAGEVRSLAERTTEAAQEIEALIGESAQRVAKGNALVQESGDKLQQIVANTDRITAVLQEIASSSHRQYQSIEDLQGAIAQLQEATRGNAQLVETMISPSIDGEGMTFKEEPEPREEGEKEVPREFIPPNPVVPPAPDPEVFDELFADFEKF
ncbi:MAG: methyl-accepting chemotaxis protein [Limnochordia bacterium]